ncbi:MAG: MFS transporter [bacterium]|nr:MFS transporter [bacterium]
MTIKDTLETTAAPAQAVTHPAPVQAHPDAGNPLRNRDFRLLWMGATAVSLAVQFYAVGLVWLVLYLTGSGLQLGTLLTVAAVPRAVSMLVSGALIDRFAPRRVLVAAALLNGLLMAVILALLGGGWMSMAALFIVAPLSGLIDATFYPTNAALVPRLVAKSQLARANALIQTADTLANIAGPSLGGIIIGEVGRLSGSPLTGLMGGFSVNALLFTIGFIVFLNLSRKTDALRPMSEHDGAEAAPEPLGKAVFSGIRYALTSPAIRTSLTMIALLNFAAIGPIVVGGALLVERRFDGDATMYGIMSGGFGIGMLAGAGVISLLGQMKRPGMALVYTAFALAAGLIALGFAPSFWFAFAACFMIGIFAAITNVNAVTWMQLKTEMHMQGRIASLLVFAAVALDPFSNAISGAVAELNLTALFVGAGLLVGTGGVIALSNRQLREPIDPEPMS